MRPAWYPCSNQQPHGEHEHSDGPDNYTYLCGGKPKPAAPADRLLAAADLLDKRAGDDLTPGPWEVRYECPEGEHHHDWDEVWLASPEGATVASFDERYTCAPRDAAYVALVHPEVGKALAAWLRAEAGRVLNGPIVFGGTRGLFTPSPEALALADVLLAGES